jgi:cytochrome b561/polyisoprenoid-binding protein YceI
MSPSRYSDVAIALHWLLAALLAFQVGTGWLIEELEPGTGLFNLAQFHKSVGISILLLSVIRVGVRLSRPAPPLMADSAFAHFAARAVHIGLYLFMIGVPLTGWILVSTSDRNIDTVLFNLIPWPHIPGLEGAEEGFRASINASATWLHGSLTWLGVALIALHLAGALRHQFIGPDPVLPRMLPLAVAGRKSGGMAAILVLAALGLGLLLFGRNFHWAPSAAVATASVATDEDPAAGPVLSPADDASTGNEAEDPETADGSSEAELDEVSNDISAPVSSWQIASDRNLGFTASWGGEAIRGTFGSWRGDIRFDPDRLAESRVSITVDLASASTADADRDQMLRTAEFFNVAAGPTATYTASSFRRLSATRFEADGTLRLKGVSMSQPLQFTLQIDGNTARVTGTSTVSRGAFGVGTGDYDDIADAVEVQFSFNARRE